MINESEIGKTIKHYRKKKKLTLQELADRTGFSKGYLSKLEKSDKAPPLSTLGTIAKVLDVTPSILLGATPEGKRISFVKANQRHLFAGNGSGFGYYYESIAHDYHDKSFEPFILTIPVDAQMIMFQHNHEEMLFILEGTMKFKHGDQEYIVEKGDCVYFDANIPHFGQALGNEKAVCLVVMHEFKEEGSLSNLSVLSFDPDPAVVELLREIGRLRIDDSAAQREWNWKTAFPLEEMVDDFIREFKDHTSWYK